MTKILIADDSALMLRMMQMSIRTIDKDLQIITVSDGQEALDKWQSERPDLTILDIHMPKMTGLEVLKRIKAQDPGSVVLMLTADKQESTQVECNQLGSDLFFKKSDNKDELLAALREIIANANAVA